MTCPCSLNAAQTTIVTPCPLHDAWARARLRAQLETLYARFDAGDKAIDATVTRSRGHAARPIAPTAKEP